MALIEHGNVSNSTSKMIYSSQKYKHSNIKIEPQHGLLPIIQVDLTACVYLTTLSITHNLKSKDDCELFCELFCEKYVKGGVRGLISDTILEFCLEVVK
jgi:hypothetical protein